jgi:taurine transport system substrate-binding protein
MAFEIKRLVRGPKTSTTTNAVARALTALIAGAAVALLSVLASPAQAADKAVVIAYQDMLVPWRYAQQVNELARATGYTVTYRKFGGGGDVIRAMASGAVQVGEAGSSPVAAGLSQGLPIQVFWILDNINDAEALVARNGSGIDTVAQLKGHRVGVPYVSTSHFDTLLALKQAGLSAKDVKVLNLRPAEISAAWERGDIDAAFVWNPVLSEIKKNGHVLTSSGKIAATTGEATFDAFVTNTDWGKQNAPFLTALVKILAKSDADYRANPAGWTGATLKGQAVAAESGGKPEDVAESLALYQFPSLQEQLSSHWLGGGSASGVSKSLSATAAFLHEQNTIQTVLPDYSIGVAPAYAQAALSK